MPQVTLIFPHQLFQEHPAIVKNRRVILAEEYLLFRVQKFHKQRLVLLRSAMKAYEKYLIEQELEVDYLESSALAHRGSLSAYLKGIKEIHIADPVDDWLLSDLHSVAGKCSCKLIVYDTPMFLCNQTELVDFFRNKKHFSMAQFYAYQRKKLNILMEDGEPAGGKYSFDTDNRKKLPKGTVVPKPFIPAANPFVEEAVEYVEGEFPDAIGASRPFHYAVTFQDANSALKDFVDRRLKLFGDYEDAIEESEPLLFHSCLSPLLNIGILTPSQVLDRVLNAKTVKEVPINSLEGFIRQIIGWREFVRACYALKGRVQRTKNFFGHTKGLPKGFWNGTTMIPPVDSAIKRVLKTGYCHHIERLMVLGNFLLLAETHPDTVYEWFMANFIDAYDWVMVPNVYGMSQYADGGQMTTKPYVSGSNYILKMSRYAKGEWTDIWDGLFWRFLQQHKALFGKNPRTKALLSVFENNRESIVGKINLAKSKLFK